MNNSKLKTLEELQEIALYYKKEPYYAGLVTCRVISFDTIKKYRENKEELFQGIELALSIIDSSFSFCSKTLPVKIRTYKNKCAYAIFLVFKAGEEEDWKEFDAQVNQSLLNNALCECNTLEEAYEFTV